MLKAMRFPALLLFAAVLPALADTRFQIRRTNRDDIPVGKGQCDIRLQVDNEVEVTVRGDVATIHTIAGQDARDDGSECNAPLPDRDIENFNFDVKESRNDIRILGEPSPRNGYAAIVRIRDNSGGFGRYHFRLTWSMTGRPGSIDLAPRRNNDFDRPRAADGFSWNNATAFRGVGRGEAWLNDFGPMRLGEVNIEIDRGGKVVSWFKSERGKGLSFSGTVVAREQNRWKADVMSDDRRYRGPLWFTVDAKGNVVGVTIEASDGRDHLQLNWDRR
jgi:uncharacterized protein YuzE